MNHEYEAASLHPCIQNAVARIFFFVCYSYHIITFLKFTLCHPFFNYIHIQAACSSLQDLDIILFYLCICSCFLLPLLLLNLSPSSSFLCFASFLSWIVIYSVCLCVLLMLLCNHGLGYAFFPFLLNVYFFFV